MKKLLVLLALMGAIDLASPAMAQDKAAPAPAATAPAAAPAASGSAPSATAPAATAPAAAAAPAATAAPAPVPNKGDTAWMLTSTAFVLLMSVPGLALFYGGMVR